MNQGKMKPIIMPALIAALCILFDNLLSSFYAIQTLTDSIGMMDSIPYLQVFTVIRLILNGLIIMLVVIGLILLLMKPVAGLGILLAPVVLSFVNTLLSGFMFIGVGSVNFITLLSGVIIASSLLVAVIGGLATQKRAVGSRRKILNVKFTVIAMDLVFLGILVSRFLNAFSRTLIQYSSEYAMTLGVGSLGIILALTILVLAIIFGKRTKTVVAIFLIILATVGLVLAFMLIGASVQDWEFVFENPLAFPVYLELILGPVMTLAMGIYGLTITNDQAVEDR